MASPGATTFATHTNSPLELIDASHVNNVQTAINNIEQGWLASEDTWVYVSASSFKITGLNRTTVYQKGTLLWFLNGGTKYAIVASSSFSTDTTVNIVVNTDYTIANSAITAPYYSYVANPQGFPGWFNYAPSVTGYSANPTNTAYRYCIKGTTVFVYLGENSPGTSNNTAKSYGLPVTAKTISNGQIAGQIMSYVDNNVAGYSGIWIIASGGTTVACYKANLAPWTNTGTCGVFSNGAGSPVGSLILYEMA